MIMRAKNRKLKIPVSRETLTENLKRIKKGKPLSVPLSILGREFKQLVYLRLPTEKVRKKRKKDNKKYYDKWNAEKPKRNIYKYTMIGNNHAIRRIRLKKMTADKKIDSSIEAYICRKYKSGSFNITKLARDLKISRQTIYRVLHRNKIQINKPDVNSPLAKKMQSIKDFFLGKRDKEAGFVLPKNKNG